VKSLIKIMPKFAAAVAAVAVTACSQSSFQPDVKGTVNPLTQTTLQFAVGTANIAGTVGLNTISTLRQNGGASVGASILSDAPTIVGPSGFVVPTAPDAYSDAGKGSITGSLQTSLNTQPPSTTFDPPWGGSTRTYNALASSLGFIPATLTSASQTPHLFPYALPFYAGTNPALVATAVPSLCAPGQRTVFQFPPAGTPKSPDIQLCYVGGPPAFVASGHTSTQDGTFNPQDPGYQLGFVDFQAAPVAGAYTLNVTVPTGLDQTTGVSSFGTKTAVGQLASVTPLAGWTTAPTFASDGSGGGTITTNFAGGPGITEEYVELANQGPASCTASGAAPFFYTFRVSPGTVAVTVPDNIGAAPPGTKQPHTLCTAAEDSTPTTPATTGDAVVVYGFAADYPLFSSAFPQSGGQTSPTIAGPNGQADITTSIASSGAE